HQADAKSILDKIRAYENAMQQGKAFNDVKDYNNAKNAYAEALRINPSGPGNPADLMAKAAVAASAPTSTPANNAVNKPPVPKPQIDVATYLADAQKAIAKRDYKKARRYLADIFTQDRNNQEAKDILADVNAKDTGVAQASDEDG